LHIHVHIHTHTHIITRAHTYTHTQLTYKYAIRTTQRDQQGQKTGCSDSAAIAHACNAACQAPFDFVRRYIHICVCVCVCVCVYRERQRERCSDSTTIAREGNVACETRICCMSNNDMLHVTLHDMLHVICCMSHNDMLHVMLHVICCTYQLYDMLQRYVARYVACYMLHVKQRYVAC